MADVRLSDLARYLNHSSIVSQNAPFEPTGITLGEHIQHESAEHAVWKGKMLTRDHGEQDMVIKLKKDGHFCANFLSSDDVESMLQNYRLVGEVADHHPGLRLRTTYYWVMEVTICRSTYLIWMEEWVRSFQKFLKYPGLTSSVGPNKYFAVSNKDSIRRLQLIMLENGKSPIVDAQGGTVIGPSVDGEYSEMIILSDIETAESLASKYNVVDAAEMELEICKQSPH